MIPLSLYPFFAGARPRIIGHRGAAGEAPENTLESFQRAFKDGAAIVEFDVRATQDREVVIIHDATLQRTTDGRGAVSRKRLVEIKKWDAGNRFTQDKGASYPYRGKGVAIPTLEEFFTSFPQARAIVEIKQERPAIVHKVVETVKRLDRVEQTLLATEKDPIMRAIRKEIKKQGLPIATGFSYGEVKAFFTSLAGGKMGSYVPPGQAFQIPSEYGGITLVSKETVAAAHRLGLEMFVWTVNEVEEMERLLLLGVDGIITDFPARLRGLLAGGRI